MFVSGNFNTAIISNGTKNRNESISGGIEQSSSETKKLSINLIGFSKINDRPLLGFRQCATYVKLSFIKSGLDNRIVPCGRRSWSYTCQVECGLFPISVETRLGYSYVNLVSKTGWYINLVTYKTQACVKAWVIPFLVIVRLFSTHRSKSTRDSAGSPRKVHAYPYLISMLCVLVRKNEGENLFKSRNIQEGRSSGGPNARGATTFSDAIFGVND